MALLVAVNAKYIHTNLAVRYLRNLCDLPMREYSINDRTETVAADIYRSGEKLILFSCYIWNIRMIIDICSRLKKADPSITLVLGGPEVSYNSCEILKQESAVDFIISHEGEKSMPQFLKAFESRNFDEVSALAYREDGKVCQNPCETNVNINEIPFPYLVGELEELRGRLIYYETSRGCPYNCGFCLSSATHGVRFLPVERVKRELMYFIDADVPLVKLVDRTFNADNKRALEIVNFIKENSKNTCFHFEVKAETMSDELIDALSTAKKGMFQLEIGVQSTNPDTLSKIKRGADFNKITEVVKRLKQNNNIHLHLDLIAGLPGENYEQFKKSFNDVFSLSPHDLQLGFLKKLKGAKLDTAGSEFTDEPPYEVIKSDAMSFGEILLLKDIEDVLEKYYNSGDFTNAIEYLIKELNQDSPFDFFADLAEYFRKKDLFSRSLSKKNLYELLNNYAYEKGIGEKVQQKIIFDYCLRYRDNLSFMNDAGLKERVFEFLKIKENINKYFPERADEKPVNLYKVLRFYEIDGQIFAFDPKKQIVCDITADFT